MMDAQQTSKNNDANEQSGDQAGPSMPPPKSQTGLGQDDWPSMEEIVMVQHPANIAPPVFQYRNVGRVESPTGNRWWSVTY